MRAGLRRVNVSLDALAPDRFFQLTRRDSLAAGARGARGRRAPPRAAADQGQRRRAARTSPRTRSCASPSSRAQHPYEVRFIEFMPLDADRTWTRDRVLPNEEVRRLIDAAYPLEAVGRERHGTSRRWRFADGQGEIGFISPVTEPFCGDCNRIRLTAEGKLRTCLFSMTETDLRGAAARRARPTTSSRRSSATPSGARSSSTTSTTRASCSRRGRCRGSADDGRLDAPIDEALARDPRADRAAGGRARRLSRTPPGAWRPRTRAAAVDLPPFDRSAMDGYAVRSADTAPGVALRLAGGVAAGEVSADELAAGTAAAISTGAALPAGRRRDPAVRAGRARSTGPSRPSARSSPAATSATAARTCARATCWRAPASG